MLPRPASDRPPPSRPEPGIRPGGLGMARPAGSSSAGTPTACRPPSRPRTPEPRPGAVWSEREGPSLCGTTLPLGARLPVLKRTSSRDTRETGPTSPPGGRPAARSTQRRGFPMSGITPPHRGKHLRAEQARLGEPPGISGQTRGPRAGSTFPLTTPRRRAFVVGVAFPYRQLESKPHRGGAFLL
jgi:hypothetical protein